MDDIGMTIWGKESVPRYYKILRYYESLDVISNSGAIQSAMKLNNTSIEFLGMYKACKNGW